MCRWDKKIGRESRKRQVKEKTIGVRRGKRDGRMQQTR